MQTGFAVCIISNMNGRIFSIEEFATFDGPGIRTTVFLKGCPLRCEWCHNPEGQRAEKEYKRIKNGCLGCGACLKAGGGRLTEESAKACPKDLVRACGEDVSAEKLCETVLKNEFLLNLNGGGVTFSGGEPLMQGDFVAECMRLLRGKVHCALQTSGYADEDVFKKVLEECDYVLFDLKLFDEEEHKKYCGKSNDKILRNYELLVASGKDFITRIPMIPGVTDTEKNIRALAGFMSELGVKKAELLPYNKLTGSKYSSVMREYTPSFDGSKEVNFRTETFLPFGIETKVL